MVNNLFYWKKTTLISYAWINLNFSEFPKKKLDPKFIPGLVRQNTFTFESIAIKIKLKVLVKIGSYYRSNKYFSIDNSSNHIEQFLTSY